MKRNNYLPCEINVFGSKHGYRNILNYSYRQFKQMSKSPRATS